MSVNPHGLILPPELSPRVARRRRSGATRFLKGATATLAMIVLLASGIGYAAFKHYNGNIHRICVFDTACFGSGARPQKVGKALNFLLIGADTRTSSSREDCIHFGCDFGGSSRADTAILVHLSPRKDKVSLLSFPRDSWVDIPGHGFNKLNSAFEAGGPVLTTRTIEKLTDIRIDHYIQVDFTGFRRMVNALNGIDICTPKPLRDKESGLNLPAGRSHVMGDMALSFVRARKSLAQGDIDRIKNQQQFLGAMLRKARSSLFSSRIFDFLDVTTKSLTFDKKLTFNDVKTLGLKLRSLDPGRVTFLTIPITTANGRRNGKSVVLLDEAQDKVLFDSIKNDGAIQGGKSTLPAVKLTVAPSRIRVLVLNGAGTKGLARRAADDLASVGFRIANTGNADSGDYAKTLVRYGPERADSAQTLAAAVPGSELQLDQSAGRTLKLVVGKNFSGAHAVTLSPVTPVPGASGKPAGPPPAATTAAQDPCAGF